MIDLSVRGLVKGFEQGNDILKGITFDINAGERVGILGRNGCGKTTFFRILSGELQPDAGTVSIASGRRLGLISQIPVYPDGWTTEDVLREAHRQLYDMEARMNELTARMATDDSPALLAEYDRLSENFRRLGGYDMEHERNRVANGLDIPAAMRAQPFDSLSGGEKTRVNLARLILEDTDILLLDEPTNHLDLRATEWLEAYLLHFRGTVLVISHDRYFLDRVVQRSIDFTSGQAEFYSGNYSFYVVERQRRFDEQLKQADLVVTGEGRIDGQSVQFGKVPIGVARRCAKANVPVLCICGGIGAGAEGLFAVCESKIQTTVSKPMALSEAIENARTLYLDAAKRLFRAVRIGQKLHV